MGKLWKEEKYAASQPDYLAASPFLMRRLRPEPATAGFSPPPKSNAVSHE